jgi:hypothetical protein
MRQAVGDNATASYARNPRGAVEKLVHQYDVHGLLSPGVTALTLMIDNAVSS